MSTCYYRCKEPVTSIRVTKLGWHADIEVWVNHGKAGELRVMAEELREVCLLFADDSSKGAPIRTHRGPGGVVVEEDPWNGITDATTMISEYGDVLTAGEIWRLGEAAALLSRGQEEQS